MQQPPQGAPGPAQPPSPQQGPGGGPQQALQQIQSGFQTLGKMIQSAGPNLPPEDVKLFQSAVQATDAFIQAITGGGGEEAGEQAPAPQARPKASGPMPMNAAKGQAPQQAM